MTARLFIRIRATIQDVDRALALWTKILGVLLILLGLMLLASPWMTYTRRETVIHTPTTNVMVKREKNIIVPRSVSLLIMGLGVLALVYASRRSRQ